MWKFRFFIFLNYPKTKYLHNFILFYFSLYLNLSLSKNGRILHILWGSGRRCHGDVLLSAGLVLDLLHHFRPVPAPHRGQPPRRHARPPHRRQPLPAMRPTYSRYRPRVPLSTQVPEKSRPFANPVGKDGAKCGENGETSRDY